MTFIFKRINILTLLVVLLFVNQSCNKKNDITTPDGSTRGGMALTFDDNYIDNWYPNLDLFDSLGVKATFYISNYNKLSNAQKVKLKEISKHGHEIAFHSTNHVDFLKCVDSTSVEKLIKNEITHGLRLMNNDGFYPTTFAYPYGRHNDHLDKLLLNRFKSVRALNGTQDLSRSLVPLKNNKLFFGLGIDEPSNRNLNKIEGLLYLAQQTNRCVVLLVHNIELWKLKEILVRAKSLNLKFYTISEISK
jgi:peptidoglycan/xylan/chitin deacetylase (PgdA/CDA1 family)